MTASRPLLLALLLGLAVGVAAAKKPRQDDAAAAERMRVELDASGGQAAATDPRLAEQLAGMAREMTDALTDIMAALQHGSDAARDGAVARLAQLSVATAEAGREQARMFRSAVVVGGALPEIVGMLQSGESPRRQVLAAEAIFTLAIDDPMSDADNFHSLEICQSGAVAPLVALLSSSSGTARTAELSA